MQNDFNTQNKKLWMLWGVHLFIKILRRNTSNHNNADFLINLNLNACLLKEIQLAFDYSFDHYFYNGI